MGTASGAAEPRPTCSSTSCAIARSPCARSVVPSTVRWDGGGGDFDWNNRFNWDSDALPTGADDVIIDVAGEITVSHSSGTNSIRSLQSQETLSLSGGSLSGNEYQLRMAKEAGAIEVLAKPFEVDDLVAVVERCLKT